MQVDAILVDDDPWVRFSWKEAGSRAGKRFLIAASEAELLDLCRDVAADVPVFVDVELGTHSSGLAVSQKMHERGFRLVFLATSHDPAALGPLTHISGVIGKEPPPWLLTAKVASTKLTSEERTQLLSQMSSAQKQIFAQRMIAFENAYYGLESSISLDGFGAAYPDVVLDTWERAIFESQEEELMQQRIQAAWRGVFSS